MITAITALSWSSLTILLCLVRRWCGFFRFTFLSDSDSLLLFLFCRGRWIVAMVNFTANSGKLTGKFSLSHNISLSRLDPPPIKDRLSHSFSLHYLAFCCAAHFSRKSNYPRTLLWLIFWVFKYHCTFSFPLYSLYLPEILCFSAKTLGVVLFRAFFWRIDSWVSNFYWFLVSICVDSFLFYLFPPPEFSSINEHRLWASVFHE